MRRLSLIILISSAVVLATMTGACGQGKSTSATVGFDTLATFKKLCNEIADNQGDYTLAGVINIKNPTNPTLEIRNVPFVFCKAGKQFYYKLGLMETLNEGGVYLYIDHDRQNIMVSAQKEIEYDQNPMKIPDLSAMLKSEHYQLKCSTDGNDRTISLLNEHHISCKQYSLTFGKDDMKLKRLFMRITDVRNPSSKETEEIVDVQVIQWTKKADLTKYINKDQVISVRAGSISGKGVFKNYKVIKM